MCATGCGQAADSKTFTVPGFCRDSLPQTGTVALYRQVMSVVITVLPGSLTATPQSAMLYVFAAPKEVYDNGGECDYPTIWC